MIARGDCGKRDDKGLFGVVKNGLLSPSQRCFEVTFHSNVVLSAARSAPATRAPEIDLQRSEYSFTPFREFRVALFTSKLLSIPWTFQTWTKSTNLAVNKTTFNRPADDAGILDTALIRTS